MKHLLQNLDQDARLRRRAITPGHGAAGLRTRLGCPKESTMTHVLHRSIAHHYPAAVSCLGHSHPDVMAAMRAQLDHLEYAHTSFFTTQAAEELADDLLSRAPAGLDHVFYVSGGSEAIEAALKLARQYFVERAEPQRRYLIARRQSYHGITTGAL